MHGALIAQQAQCPKGTGICENARMTDLNTVEHMHALGQQAKKASALMAKASAAVKNQALRRLAALLRDNTETLQLDNAKDLARAPVSYTHLTLPTICSV